jgi:DNA-directed RNA polymerase alpha subunit
MDLGLWGPPTLLPVVGPKMLVTYTPILVSVIGISIAVLSYIKSQKSDRNKASAELITAETTARTEFAKQVREDMRTCKEECAQLRVEVEGERDRRENDRKRYELVIDELRSTVQRVESENRELRAKVEDLVARGD